ncbi:hypothetical protein JCM24511_05992 [Saitozyma sp. JCM 24511]|nr:hypothetical protein JCM24511_05992 [Saitozyma sp. JCM 24511]
MSSRPPSSAPSRTSSFQLRTQPPSRPGSTTGSASASGSGTATPVIFPPSTPSLALSATPTSAATPSLASQEHTTTLSHKLRHMFDSQRYAVFDAVVKIHELGNVPQLEGEFQVKYKFRGKKPKGKDATLPHKPSLPNLKLNQPLSTINPSASSLSLRSSSTAASSPVSPLAPIRPTLPASSSTNTARSKAMSLPPPALSPVSPTKTSPPRKADCKKASDPTPLRQSLGPDDLDPQGSQGSQAVAAREIMEEPEDAGDLRTGAKTQAQGQAGGAITRTRAESQSSGGSGEPNGSIGSSDSKRSSTSQPNSGASFNTSSRPSSALVPPSISARPPSLAPSTVSSSSHLSVAFPRSGVPPPARSGTMPAPSTILDSVQGMDEWRDLALGAKPSRTISRTSSVNTGVSSVTGENAGAGGGGGSHGHGHSGFLHPHRARSASGPGPPSRSHSMQSSSSRLTGRKGRTQARSLRQHTCTWDSELQHTMRIPLSKPPAQTSGSLNPYRRQQSVPVLGAGPLSESGIRLVIEQLPTAAATSMQQASGADKDSLGSVLSAAHHAAHPHGTANPSEGKKSTSGEKTVFGIVDVDLAAFAGKGKTTRRFLLRGSRTNATIKLTVDMRWIGGEETWVAPPMQEGHHVTNIQDLVGTEAQDNIKNDLHLAKTPSNSSSASSTSLTRSNRSMGSSLNLAASHSAISLVGHRPEIGYKSYEHHLLHPSDASRLSPSRHPSPSTPASGTPAASHSTLPSPGQESPPSLNGHDDALLFPFRQHHHHHRFHHHHHHASHHSGMNHMRDFPDRLKVGSSAHEIQPEMIIEAVFNPRPALQEGPLTFVPEEEPEQALEGEDEVLQQVVGTNGPGPGPEDDKSVLEERKGAKEHGRLGWPRMRAARAAREKEKREREKNRVVSGMSIAAAG